VTLQDPSPMDRAHPFPRPHPTHSAPLFSGPMQLHVVGDEARTDYSGFLPAPIRMTLNDLECAIHLKVLFTDGTLDASLLWVSDSTRRIDIARGGVGGVG